MSKQYYVYILASQRNGTLYIGVTSDLNTRTLTHKAALVEGLTSKYEVTQLVYFETYTEIAEAIQREKQLKRWNRQWKLRLIESVNPKWEDLYTTV